MDEEIKNEFGKVRKEFREEFGKVRKEFREEFKNVRKEFREEFKNVRTEMADGFSKCVSKIEFCAAIEEIKENMMTKSDYNILITMLEQMLPEFQASQRSNVLTGKQLCDMDDKIADHESRIRILEAQQI